MTENKDFDNEDENILSHRDVCDTSPAKGNRVIPTRLMEDFMAWLSGYHREIQMVSDLDRAHLKQLIDEFEFFTVQHYDFTIQEWQYNLTGK